MGHAVRVASVLEQLRRLVPLRLTVVAPCDPRIWPRLLTDHTENWVGQACDAGVLQSDDVTVDLESTGAALDRWLSERPALIEREVERLGDGFDLVVGDVPSLSFEAATRLEIPSVAVANFSWDWIYSELGFAEAAEAAAAGYAQADLLLQALPFGPMPAFPRRVEVGLVARESSDQGPVTRTGLGVGASQSAVLLAFQPSSAPTIELPPERPERVFLVPSAWPIWQSRRDVRRLPAELAFEDAMAAADVVVGKPGYGLIGDVEAAAARFLYVPRPGFPENAVLEEHLSRRLGTLSLAATRLRGSSWEEELQAIEAMPAPPAAPTGGAVRAAAEMAVALGVVDTVEVPD